MLLNTISLLLLSLFAFNLYQVGEGGLLGPNETTPEKLLFHLTRRYAVKEIIALKPAYAPAQVLKIYQYDTSENKATVMVGNFSMKTSTGIKTECSLVFDYKYTTFSGWYPKIISVNCPES